MRAEEFASLYALEEHHWWFAGMREVAAAILDRAGAGAGFGQRPKAILDLGCGTGFVIDWLARYAGGTPVTGLEYSADGVRFCRERGHRELVQASAVALPFAAASFDLVTSFEVFDELPDDRPGFREVARVLRPGGYFLIRLPALEWLRSSHDAAMHTYRRMSLAELKAKLGAAGLEVERATYVNCLLLAPIAALRLTRNLVSSNHAGSDVQSLPPVLAWLERGFLACLKAEARWLRSGPRAALPVGVSIMGLARKPG
jgi:SAM-dependent methyltransferase